MKNIFILLISTLFFQINSIFAQNLVPNPSFENNTKEEKNWSPINSYSSNKGRRPNDWFILEKSNSPDYYFSTKEEKRLNYKNPEKNKARSGKYFIGLHLNYGIHREYISVKLKNHLEKDQLYCVKSYILLSSNASKITNVFDFLFSSSSFLILEANEAKRKLIQVINPDFFTSRDSWVCVGFTYLASGDENYLTIGALQEKEVSTITSLNTKGKIYLDKSSGAYYLVDDVSVEAIDSKDKCLCENQDTINRMDTQLPFLRNRIQEMPSTNDGYTISNQGTKDTIFEFQDYLFKFGSYNLNPINLKPLENILNYCKVLDSFQMRISGFTDDLGSVSFNQELSRRRAEEIKSFFVKNGIKASSIIAEGYGSSSPKYPNDSEKNRQLNRRVEVRVRR